MQRQAVTVCIQRMTDFLLRLDRRWRIFLLTGSALVIAAVLGIIVTAVTYSRGGKVYARAAERYFVSYGSGRAYDGKGEDDFIQEVSDMDWWELADADLDGMAEEYPDVVGWIWFEDGSAGYPVVYSGDNEKYLRRAYTGERIEAGSIFLDGGSSPDFSDTHTLIYGHNMKDGSMFGALKNYKASPDYYEGHRYFQIFTDNKKYRYLIFAFEDVPRTHPLYYAYGSNPHGFGGIAEGLMRDSYMDTGVSVDASDHVITLSTCTGDDEERFVVCAVRVGEK